MISSFLFPLAPLALWALGALLGLVAAARRDGERRLARAAYACGALGGLVGLIGAVAALVPGGAATIQWTFNAGATSDGGPLAAAAAVGVLAFAVDPLAALFGVVLCGAAVAVSVYALGYQPAHRAQDAHVGPQTEPHAPPAPHTPQVRADRVVPVEGHLVVGYHAFLAAMLCVFLADSVLAFLLAWEVMSIASFFLVLFDHHDPAVRRAGYVYLVMTHAGTAFVIAALLLLAGHGDGFTFDAMRTAGQAGGAATWKTAVFVFGLIGFGTKAGLLPLHVWLPRAHPAAPTHVSALMSGVMVKTGIYGLVRLTWDLLGGALPAWTGWLLLSVGVASAVLGVLYALMEHDLKRLLAYHTVENIGIIAIGLGAALLLGTAGLPAAAALALAAGLFHTLNHAVFKSLLFMGAGAILQATHTRDLEQMGGLIRRMPWTAATFLVGALAISGIPPLNGFASEWLTFQSLLALARAGTPGTPGAAWYAWEGWYAVGAVGAVALLGLTAALAVACFVKAFGGAFLALPRHRHAAEAVEAPVSMRWGMVSLAAACVALGLLSGGAFGAISAVAAPLVPVVPVQTALAATYTGTEGADGASATWSAVSAPRLAAGTTPGVFAAPALLALIASAGALGLILRRSVGRGARVRRAPTWVCGFDLQPHMEYTPTSFAEPIRVIFAWAVQPFRHTEVEYAPGTENYFVHTLRYHAGVHPPIERVLYQRGLRLVLGASHQLRRLQAGSLRLYLAYMLAALAALLAWGR